MLRKFSLLTAFLLYVLSMQAQAFKFGVHVDPIVSFMASSRINEVKPDGANMAFGLGVEMEYYFSDKENYAFTFGGNFALGKGGKLYYNNSGVLFPNSTLFESSYFRTDSAGLSVSAPSGDDLKLVAGTTVRYNVNYLEIPFGLKLRTNELGQSYMRAFFHIPTVTIGIPVSARGTVNAPEQTTDTSFEYYTKEPVKGENIYKDINFLQLSLGTGAGVEWSPNDEGGLRLVGGFYYNYGFIDMIKKNAEKSVRTGFHNIGLRIGIIF